MFEEITEEERKMDDLREINKLKKEARKGKDSRKIQEGFDDVAFCYNCIDFISDEKDGRDNRCLAHPSLHPSRTRVACKFFKAKPGKLKIKEKVIKKKEKKDIREFKEDVRIMRLDGYLDNVKAFHKRMPFFFDKSGMFWLWDREQKKYGIVDDIDMMVFLDRILGFQGQTISYKIKQEYLDTFRRVGRVKIPKEPKKKWIQFKDKVISIESGKLYDVTPDYFFTNPIPWTVGKSSKTPKMDKFMKEWVGAKYIRTAYEIIAYCCYADYPIHLMFCLIGSGRNGKSKFLGLINKFIGMENICSTELDTLIESRFEGAKLYKKLVCSLGETNFGVLSRTSLLKKLTGQDLIGFEFKNKKPFDAPNYAKIIISSNSLPTSEDTSEGFYRRWLIINFPNTFKEGRDILQDIPDWEYENLAKKVTKILPSLLKRGNFTNQGSIEKRKEQYILASNPLSYFIEIACDKGFDKFMRYSELFMNYKKYLYLNKKRTISYKEFNEVLAIEGLEVQRTSKNINGTWINDRFINGIELSLDWEKRLQNGNMTLVTPVTDISLSGYREEKSIEKCYESHKCHKNIQKEIPIEKIGSGNKIIDRFTPTDTIYHKCHVCGDSPCNWFDNQKNEYICNTCRESIIKN